MKINGKNVFLLRKRVFSDVLEQVILENFSRDKHPDPQMSLCEVDTFVREKCFSIDDLQLKSIWFIALE